MRPRWWKRIVLSLIPLLGYAIAFDGGALIAFHGEEGYIEDLGALFFLLASGGFLAAYFYSSGAGTILGRVQTRRNIWYLLLGLLFLVCCGEEISWGQHTMKWETPPLLQQINAQQETNIHNLRLFQNTYPDGRKKSGIALLLTMNSLFNLFWFTFCVILPLADKRSVTVRKVVDHVGLPRTPGWIGVLFLANYLTCAGMVYLYQDTGGQLIRTLKELKESNAAFIFTMLAYHVLQVTRTPLGPGRRFSSQDYARMDDSDVATGLLQTRP